MYTYVLNVNAVTTKTPAPCDRSLKNKTYIETLPLTHCPQEPSDSLVHQWERENSVVKGLWLQHPDCPLPNKDGISLHNEMNDDHHLSLFSRLLSRCHSMMSSCVDQRDRIPSRCVCYFCCFCCSCYSCCFCCSQRIYY